MIDLSGLMKAIDASDGRVAQAQNAYEAAQAIADHHKAFLHDETIANDALKRALFLVNSCAPEAAEKPPEKAPATVTRRKDTLAKCIAAIRSHHLDVMENTDRSVAAALKDLGYKFRLPTVRRAMAKISQERQTSAKLEREAGDPLEIPESLRRTPNHVEAQ